MKLELLGGAGKQSSVWKFLCIEVNEESLIEILKSCVTTMDVRDGHVFM